MTSQISTQTYRQYLLTTIRPGELANGECIGVTCKALRYLNPVANFAKQRLLYAVAALLTMFYLPPLSLAATPATAADAHVQLRWEVERNVFTAKHPKGRSWATLTLTNLDRTPLPARGWAIYFTSIAGVDLASSESKVIFEQVNGGLFRFRPTSEFPSLATGQSVQLSYFHPELMSRTDKAPTGPYLVFDAEPKLAHAISDYKILPLTRPEQLDQGNQNGHSLMSAEALFARNENIVDIAEKALPPVFPTPEQFERRSGYLNWTTLPKIEASKALAREAALAETLLKPYFASGRRSAGSPGLHLLIGPVSNTGGAEASPEAYELSIDPVTGVTVKGNSAAGVAHGLQSFRFLLPKKPQQGVTMAALFLRDAPRFAYRGLMLDVARNFQSKQVVFRLLDLMARYKLNKFHFHLTDDEGWRLEIAGIPELTEVGARRGHTLDSRRNLPPAYGSGPAVSDAHGSGFYTRKDYIEILKYAAARHIEVIPEIEMPGHARAAVKAMEARSIYGKENGGADSGKYLLSDPIDQSEYSSAQMYTDNVMNPGMPSTYVFIEHVVAEVVALHKQAGVALHTIHVGGDELPGGAWEKSPAALALMKQQNISTRSGLWEYFYQRVAGILHEHGLFASGWEELGARTVVVDDAQRLRPNPFFLGRELNLFVWNNLDGAQDLAYRLSNAGYRTILAPATSLYFDMAHNKNPEESGVSWATYTDLDTVFDFIPFDFIRKSVTDPTHLPGRDGLTMEGQRNIMGLEGTLFSETMREPVKIEYLLMPRMLALAERAWAVNPAWAQEKDPATIAELHASAWSIFVNQLGKQVLPRLDAELLDFQYRIPPPGLKVIDHKVYVNHQLPGFSWHYSSDENEPTCNSSVVNFGVPLLSRSVIQVVACDRNGRSGRPSRIDNR